ncbi:MAG: ThuA domain-containing protein [Pirellulales bacterium]|nr:ThuA domain-containing protein [Pirellulales bacterium]
MRAQFPLLNSCLAIICALTVAWPATGAESPGVKYAGKTGPVKAKQIVLVSGDEEYRSEEMLPQLGKILAAHHGFECTVLFPIDTADGTIHPNVSNIPGLEALKTADLLILMTRFRDLPDDQMQHIADYLESGKPIIGIRTATHAFNIPDNKKFAKFSFNNKDWDGGFGRQVLGETWINHHGNHGSESTRGIIAPDAKEHPITRGLQDGDIWGPTDVYGVRLPLPKGCQPVVLGQVVDGMSANDPPVKGEKNEPMMPIAWTYHYAAENGKLARIFTSTMGSAQDFENEGYRRLLVNAAYWALNMDDQIKPGAKVEIVGEYRPSKFAFNGFVKGKKPSDHEWEGK